MKRIVLVLLLAVSMIFTAACGGKKDEPADTSSQETEAQEEEKKEASEATSSQVTEETATETEKTEWGNDEYGYITLSSDWHKFVTSLQHCQVTSSVFIFLRLTIPQAPLSTCPHRYVHRYTHTLISAKSLDKTPFSGIL